MTIFHPDLHSAPKFPPRLDLLSPLRRWLDRFEIHDQSTATLICRLIPCNCPFERTLQLFKFTVHIPPLCKLNPLYNELICLRLQALSYLTDCGEDVTQYIC